MAQLTFQDVITYVQDEIPNFPAQKIGRRLNVTLEMLYDRIKQIQSSTFTTRAATESGTVSVTQNSNAVTFSGTPLLAADGLRMVKIDGDATWYVLTFVSTSTGTLSSVFAGATNATATYKIVYPTVTFPSTVGQILQIRREGLRALIYAPDADIAERIEMAPSGYPMYFSPYIYDSGATPDDSLRVLLTPYPDTLASYAYQYFSRPILIDPASVTPSTEKVPLPTTFRKAILLSTLGSCWMTQDKETGMAMEGIVEKAVRDAMASVSTTPADQRRSAFDSRVGIWAMQDRPSS